MSDYEVFDLGRANAQALADRARQKTKNKEAIALLDRWMEEDANLSEAELQSQRETIERLTNRTVGDPQLDSIPIALLEEELQRRQNTRAQWAALQEIKRLAAKYGQEAEYSGRWTEIEDLAEAALNGTRGDL